MFLERINYEGDFKDLCNRICSAYKLGNISDYKIIEIGYEDLNVVLAVGNNKYLLKLFSTERTFDSIERYINLMLYIVENGIRHPKLFSSEQGYLTNIENVYCCIMEYIDGKNLYESEYALNIEDKKFLVKEVAKIHEIKLDVKPVYDSWAIINIVGEFGKITGLVTVNERNLLTPIMQEFSKKVDFAKLPHCFVHGDIIKTNLIKVENKMGLYIIDFSVANIYPRIQELAVLMCNLFFDENYKDNYLFLIREYNKHHPLTEYEGEILPLFIQAAHVMTTLGAIKARSTGNSSRENNYWYDQGVKGVKLPLLPTKVL